MKLNKLCSCFKTYDIRGQLNVEINEDIAFRIGYATAKKLTANKVVVGYDARESLQHFQILQLKVSGIWCGRLESWFGGNRRGLPCG